MLRMYLVRPDGVYRTSVLQAATGMNPVRNAMQVAQDFTRIAPMAAPRPTKQNTRPSFVWSGTRATNFGPGCNCPAGQPPMPGTPKSAVAMVTAASSTGPASSAGPSVSMAPTAAPSGGVSGFAGMGDYSGWWKWLAQRARFAYDNVRGKDKLFVGQNVFSTKPKPSTQDPSGAATTAAGLAPAMNPTQTLPGGWPTQTKVGVQIAEKSAGGLPPGIVLPSPGAAAAVAPNYAMRPDLLATSLVRGPKYVVDRANAQALQNFYHTYRNY